MSILNRSDFQRSRNESLEILQNAIRNKTLSCYNENVTACEYYTPSTQTCCAVGVLIDPKYYDKEKVLDRFFPEANDCPIEDHFYYLEDNANIYDYEYSNMLFGLTRTELMTLQELHDQIINLRHRVIGDNKEKTFHQFESYAMSLVA